MHNVPLCSQNTAHLASGIETSHGGGEQPTSSKQSPKTATLSKPSRRTSEVKCSSFWCALMPMYRPRMVSSRSCAAQDPAQPIRKRLPRGVVVLGLRS